MGRAGRRGCVHVTPDLTHHVASDESSCLTSLSLKRDRQPLLSACPPLHRGPCEDELCELEASMMSLVPTPSLPPHPSRNRWTQSE